MTNMPSVRWSSRATTSSMPLMRAPVMKPCKRRRFGMHLRLYAALGLCVLLAACGSSDSPPERGGRLAPIEYTKAGGVGGVGLRLKVEADGVANLDGYSFVLRDEERADLTAAMRDVDFEANAGHDRGDPHPDA